MENIKVIPIVYATDQKYAAFTDVSIQSIIAHSSQDFFYEIYVFHTGLNDDSIKKLESSFGDNYRVKCLDVSSFIDKYQDRLYSHTYFSKEMYYRILIPDVLPQYSKVLYIDGDTILLEDISFLYNIELFNNYIAACRNIMHQKMRQYVFNVLSLDPNEYINSGVLLINCDAFRQNSIKEKIFSEITKRDVLSYPDQDLLNLICNKHILYLPLEWNYLWHMERLNTTKDANLHIIPEDLSDFRSASEKIKLLHYTGDKKPWFYNAIPKSDFFWKYVSQSSFKQQIYKDFEKYNSKLKKIKFEFVHFDKKNITFTCSVYNLFPGSNEAISVCYGGNLLSPALSKPLLQSQAGIKIYKRNFKFEIPLTLIGKTSLPIYLIKNNKSVLFEYGKFFPLNGLSASYFIFNHKFLIKRIGKMLSISLNSGWKRLANEIIYDKQLIAKKKRLGIKSVIARWIYFITRPFMNKHIWLFSDRPNIAGDNGQALFEYVTSLNKKVIKPYFVISKKSADYKTLKNIGNVIQLSSIKHKFLMMHAEGVAVSQTDYELFNVFQDNFVKDIIFKRKRVFLQHGITKDDISSLYSKFSHNFDLFITAARPEYASIINNPYYGLNKKEVKLTGFPRHDKLINKKEKLILITPTWRKNLLLDPVSGKLADNFIESDYFNFYHALLSNQNLHNCAKKMGYKILFLPHDLMEKSIPFFSDIKDITILGRKERNYSELFSKGAILVSDYSSNTFEFAIMKKPVLYSQFDKESFFNSHTYKKGFFDYEQDGFGEVTYTIEDTVKLLISYMKKDCNIKRKYLKRIQDFYAFSTSGNCERVYQQILKIE